MADGSSIDQSAFDTWRKLLESTMKGNPAVQASAEQAVEGGKDSWTDLIDQLWQANPYSKLVPLDPAEITLEQASGLVGPLLGRCPPDSGAPIWAPSGCLRTLSS